MKIRPLLPKSVSFSTAKAELSNLLSEAEETGVPVLIFRDDKPVGVLVGFANDEDYFDWKTENDPFFRDGLEDRLTKSAIEAKAGALTSLSEFKQALNLIES